MAESSAGSGFQLRNVPLLSRVGADRSDHLRTDIDAAIAGWADAAVLRRLAGTRARARGPPQRRLGRREVHDGAQLRRPR